MLLSHVTVADPDSSDSSRLYPNERYKQSNSIPTKCLLSAPKQVFTTIIIIIIIIINSGFNNQLRVRVYPRIADQMSTCPETEVNERAARLWVTFDQQDKSSTTVSHLAQNYCWKSVAMQIIHDARLAPTTYSDRKIFLHRGSH